MKSHPFHLTTYALLLKLIFVSAAGAGWVQQQSGTTASLRSVYFINAQTGWAAGESSFVLRTTDGGEYWIRHIIDPSVTSSIVIRFWDASMGFVCGSQGMYKSTDGGLYWRNIPQLFMNPPYEIVFVTPQKGWLVGFMLASGDGGRGSLYQTTDGGESWILRDSSSRYAFRDVAFADSLFGWYTADNHAIFSSSSGYMKQTSDGGSTWQTVSSGGSAYGTLRFANDSIAWRSWRMFVPPGPGFWGMEKTTNRGVRWTNIYGGGGYWMPPISVPDSRRGWILLRDSLMATSNGGASWSRQVPPGSYKWDVFFTDSLNGWLVGDQGLILHTTDGGSGVWEDLQGRFQPLTPNLSFSVFPNPFTSYATLPGHSSDRFTLYDVSGRRVGTYTGDRIGEGLQAGVYFVRAEKGEASLVRIVKVR